MDAAEKVFHKQKECASKPKNNPASLFEIKKNVEKELTNNKYQNRNLNFLSLCSSSQRAMLNELKMQSDQLKIQLNLFMQAQNTIDSVPKRVDGSDLTFRNFGSDLTSTDSTQRIVEDDNNIQTSR